VRRAAGNGSSGRIAETSSVLGATTLLASVVGEATISFESTSVHVR
jgi:hypothetical protein